MGDACRRSIVILLAVGRRADYPLVRLILRELRTVIAVVVSRPVIIIALLTIERRAGCSAVVGRWIHILMRIAGLVVLATVKIIFRPHRGLRTHPPDRLLIWLILLIVSGRLPIDTRVTVHIYLPRSGIGKVPIGIVMLV